MSTGRCDDHDCHEVDPYCLLHPYKYSLGTVFKVVIYLCVLLSGYSSGIILTTAALQLNLSSPSVVQTGVGYSCINEPECSILSLSVFYCWKCPAVEPSAATHDIAALLVWPLVDAQRLACSWYHVAFEFDVTASARLASACMQLMIQLQSDNHETHKADTLFKVQPCHCYCVLHNEHM